MPFTTRRKRPIERKSGKLRDARLIVIATEGEKTEKAYFDYFSRHETRIQIVIIPSCEGKSAPKHVLDRLKLYKKTIDLSPKDELWLVIDKDRWSDKELARISSEARRFHFKLALSNPCFELWLFFHLANLTEEIEEKNCEFFKTELRRILGAYNPSNIEIERFLPGLDAAISRAESLDNKETGDWPQKTGTRVYKIFQSIRQLMKR